MCDGFCISRIQKLNISFSGPYRLHDISFGDQRVLRARKAIRKIDYLIKGYYQGAIW